MNKNELKPRRWLLVVLMLIAIAIVVVLLNKLIVDHNERKKKASSEISDMIDNQKKTSSEIFEKIEISAFNSKYELYVGQQYGSSVIKVLDDVIINNKKTQDHIITVVFENFSSTNPEEIKDVKKRFDDWTKYEILADYDDNGYLNKLTIEK